jgi:hypothetical protein
MQYVTKKRSNPLYAQALAAFKKQFKDVIKITKLYVNDNNKIYAAEWIDSKGVPNFNTGFAPDVAIDITFVD